jgi:hypothetical protein
MSNPIFVYVTTRNYATQMAALAQVTESIDEGTEQVLLDARLATSSLGLIEAVFGKTVNTGNIDYDLDVYRQILVELRSAYRYWGGTVDGMARAVRAFTQISPLILPVAFGPVWILGKDILNPLAKAQRTYYTTSTLTNVNASGAGVSIFSISNTVGVGIGTLNYYAPGGVPRMSWTPPNGNEGPQVEILTNSEYTLYGADYFDGIVAEHGPYTINPGDVLSMNIDGHGIIDIPLPAGSQTATALAIVINAALNGDSRYGVAYGSVASAYINMLRLYLPSLNSIQLISHAGSTQTLFNVPYIRERVINPRPITVSVGDRSLFPLASCFDSVTVEGTGAPDGWIVTSNSGSAVTPTPFNQHTYFSLDRDVPFDLNTNGMVSIPVPNEVLKYKGFNATVSVWGRSDYPFNTSTIASIGISFDNQASWVYSSPPPVGVEVNAENKPKEWVVVTRIPANATKMWFRVKLDTGTGNFTIHKARVMVSPIHGGLYLGEGTTPRNEHLIKQGSMLFYWGKDPITDDEKLALGFTSTSPYFTPGYSDQSKPGHVDNIAPTEAYLEKFDVSEYDIGGLPLNVKGVFTSYDFNDGTSINLDPPVIRSPDRFSYLIPSAFSDMSQTVVFSAILGFPYVAPLMIASDQDMRKSVLLKDGVPLTQTDMLTGAPIWRYNSSMEIELFDPPTTTSTYTFNYNTLIRFESAPIDMGVSFTDYMWLADYNVWLRPEIRPIQVLITTGLQFGDTTKVTLTERATMDTATSTLIEDTGLSKRIIPSSQWKYLDANTIQIDPDIYNDLGLYEFTYMAEINHPSIDATNVIEIKSATSVPGLALATYTQVGHNTPIDQYRYHQMRVTLSNIRDLRDARIQSLVIKGLNAFGVGGHIPILRP